MKPQDCRYSETHEWTKPVGKGKNEVIVGLSDHAVTQLSDLVHLELPSKGDKVEQGVPFGEIESVKTVADLVSPVSGRVTQVNEDAVESPETITEDPYGDGWLVKIKMDDPKELDSLMTAKEYEEFIETSEDEGEEEEEDEVDEDDFM